MCYHKLYIFATCGHSFYRPTPLLTCRHASIAPTSSYSKACEMAAHPFHSLKIESLCSRCERQRSTLLENLESRQVVRFNEWQWKVSYSKPDVEVAEVEGPSTPSSKKREKKDKTPRGSWRRSNKGRSEKANNK